MNIYCEDGATCRTSCHSCARCPSMHDVNTIDENLLLMAMDKIEQLMQQEKDDDDDDKRVVKMQLEEEEEDLALKQNIVNNNNNEDNYSIMFVIKSCIYILDYQHC